MFGMGTGGSLRLLSPEIWGCQGGMLLLRLPLRSGSLRAIPRRSLCFSPDLLLRSARFALPFPRTLKTAQVRFRFPSPDQGALPLLASTFCFPPNHLSRSQVSLSGLCFALAPLFPNPYSLFPRSSPRPISIIKLHTLPHFHR